MPFHNLMISRLFFKLPILNLVAYCKYFRHIFGLKRKYFISGCNYELIGFLKGVKNIYSTFSVALKI